jgi:HSP20 family molecular chaperone IbpA
MQEQNLIRNQTVEPPILIRTTGLSVEARKLFDSIARRAYEIFESEGRVQGRDLDYWLRAESELFQPAPLEVSESREGVTVLADVRGFAPKELEVDLEPRRVTIIGKHYGGTERKTEGSNSSTKLTTELVRSLQLPVEIDTRQTTARLRSGILELDMKKTAAAQASKTQPRSAGNVA